MCKAVGLMSGGLDSMLAVRLLREQQVDVLGVCFITPFFSSVRAEAAARQLDVPLRVLDISEEHLAMVKNPAHGYGKTMNPCIDCHALMFRRAGELMEAEGRDFLFSGEVLNERPMSQNRKALAVVAETSGYPDHIVRPLSAKLLAETRPEREGLVDRSRLLDFHGRSRKPQMALARQWGITDYPTPAGGCLLTEQQFSLRLGDLLDHEPDAGISEVEMLKVGRHFRLSPNVKMVCGRNRAENDKLEALARPQDTVLRPLGVPGPSAVLLGPPDPELLELAASLLVRYSDTPPATASPGPDTVGRAHVTTPGGEHTLSARAASQDLIDRLQIK